VGDSTTEQDPVSDSAASLSFGVRLGLSNGKRGLIYKERVSLVEEVDFFPTSCCVHTSSPAVVRNKRCLLPPESSRFGRRRPEVRSTRSRSISSPVVGT
jgi:hypothetical protein